MPPCGDAEQTSTLVRSECRLPPLLVEPIVAAAKVGSPPFVSVLGVMLRSARMSWKGWQRPFAAPGSYDCFGLLRCSKYLDALAPRVSDVVVYSRALRRWLLQLTLRGDGECATLLST